jgi:hypothetical protein
MPFFAPSNNKGPQSDAAVNDLNMMNADNTGILSALKVLNGKIEDIRKPSGQDRKSPARTCLDLYLTAQENGEQLDNGLYWVDPNQGCEADAIEVFCDFSSHNNRVETCVHATESKISKASHAAGWWSESDEGMPISYDPVPEARVPRADYTSQITFLRLLATHARQTVTYHCNGGEANLKVRGTGASEFTESHADFEVLSDGCNGQSSWARAIVQVNTKATARMPIKDVYTQESGDQFGIDVGPICFS